MTQAPLADGEVLLTAYTAEDATAQLAGEDDEQRRRFGFPGPSTPETFAAGLQRWEQGWREGRAVTYAARDARTGELLGGCELRRRDAEVGELSYWVFAAHRRRGLAVRATRLLVTFAFQTWDLRRLELRIHPDNDASLGVAQRLGFACRQEGDEMRCVLERA